MAAHISLFSLDHMPVIKTGDNLARLILEACDQNAQPLADGDVIVIAQKIVSKAEGRSVRLESLTPSARAIEVAEQTDKDPRLVELILSESTQIIRQKKGVLIVAHRLGFVMANAGIDQSNVNGEGEALLLPIAPDESANLIRETIQRSAGINVRIIINDSFGRPWRNGTVGHAIGVAGFEPLKNYIGTTDLFGRTMVVTQAASADELAAAASFLMGQGAEGTPVVVIKGAKLEDGNYGASALVRPVEEDLFR